MNGKVEVAIRFVNKPIPTITVPRALGADEFTKLNVQLREQYDEWRIRMTDEDRMTVTFSALEIVE